MSAPSKRRLVFLALIAAGYVLIAWRLDWLGFAPAKDEVHFWPTTLRFAAEPIPSRTLLRSYGELNTPLPFMVFGWLEAALGGGIVVGRLFNAVVSFAMAVLFVLSARGRDRRVIAAAIAAWTFPYLIGTSFYLYTDVLAVAFALAGFIAVRRGMRWTGAVAFVLAVSSRQYMVAVPAALALHRGIEIIRERGVRGRGVAALAADPVVMAGAAGVGALVGWFVFFGGFAPANEIADQAIRTTSAGVILPRNGLYFLAVIGAYFVPLSYLLFDRDRRLLFWGPRWVVAAVVLAVGGLFLLFPPVRNLDYDIETMGFLDKALRRLVGDHDVVRVAVLWMLASMAVVRFRRWSLASALVLVHAVMLMKAHIAWDKYAMVCLVCLWYLHADWPPAEAARAPARVRPPDPALAAQQDPSLG
ncbi:MAG: hypothetical protein H6810_08745 [Phycisphaeraceae bacterium]|nr:MAG: hypothetical protein H6810_08745 [Phycisphaeraceae bacterium]